jgi:hypothetical protein
MKLAQTAFASLLLLAPGLARCNGLVVVGGLQPSDGGLPRPPLDGRVGADGPEDASSQAVDAGSSSPSAGDDAADDTANGADEVSSGPEAGVPVDAPAACSAACAGCCDSTGNCQGGQSAGACGAGGGQCQDCSVSGSVCSAGSCVLAYVDAGDGGDGGSVTCVVSTCTNLCVPYFAQCCKVDQTCGCGLVFPPGPCT